MGALDGRVAVITGAGRYAFETTVGDTVVVKDGLAELALPAGGTGEE